MELEETAADAPETLGPELDDDDDSSPPGEPRMKRTHSSMMAEPGSQSPRRLSPDDFEPLALVGRGAFGEVRLVRRRDTREVFALKSMLKTAMVAKNQVAHIRAERDMLALSEDLAIAMLFDSFQTPTHLYMVMEFLPGGDLMSLLVKLDTLPEDACKFYVAEIASAVQAVHDHGFAHRDVKPDNVLLDWDGHVKLTDLGLCVRAPARETSRGRELESRRRRVAAAAASRRVGGGESPPRRRRGYSAGTGRGGAAAASWRVGGDESRRGSSAGTAGTAGTPSRSSSTSGSRRRRAPKPARRWSRWWKSNGSSRRRREDRSRSWRTRKT